MHEVGVSERVRELLAPGRARWRLGATAAVAGVVLLLTVAVLVAAVVPQGRSEVLVANAGESAGSGDGSAVGTGSDALGFSGADPAVRQLVVHVLGEVRAPGVYALPAGARVVDAIALAGGFAEQADQGALNLAALVEDGEQLVVPRRGAGAKGAASAGAAAATDSRIDLNTADATALQTLPRVGPALAERILAWRAEHGRFRRVEDLLSVTGIGPKTFEGLRAKVRV